MSIKTLVITIATFFSINLFGQIQLGNTKLIELDYANPQEYEIGGLKATGIQFLDPNSLISITGLKVGDRITIPSDQITKAIKKLWAQGILGDVKVNISKIQDNYIFLEFELAERPRLSKFKFNGVRKSEADDIRESIDLIRGKVVTEAMINKTKNKVTNYFVLKGFRNVVVNINEQSDPNLPNSIILEIDVNKQEKVKIDAITFSGNTSYSSEVLRRKMKDTKVQKFYRVMKASKLLEGAFVKDKEAIESHYNSKGFRDAKISFDTIYNVGDNRVAINMKIEEGAEYYFGNVSWSGNFLYTDDTLSGILNIKKGTVYNKEVLDKKLNYNPSGIDITSLYMDDGYLFFNIIPVEVRVDSNIIDIEMRIYEGEQATIRNIIISGNTVTSDHVIRRELYTLPGQKFSRTDLIRSQRELSQLGYFNPETIGINPKPDPATGLVDIEYTLEEKPSNQITLSGGWGGFQGVVGTLGLVYTNFSARKIFKLKEYAPLPSGDGQRMSIQAQASGRRYQNYSLSFTEPWLGGRRPNSLTVSINQSIIRQIPFSNTDPTPEQTGALKITGANVYLGRRLKKPDDFFQLTNSIGLNRYKSEGLYPIAIVDNNIASNLYEASFNTLGFTSSLSRNSIDNPTYPRKGSQMNLSLSLTPPVSLFSKTINESDFATNNDYLKEKYKWIEYHKWNFDFSAYTPLTNGPKKRAVLQTKANFGVIGNYNKAVGTGPFERFVLGGTGMSGFGGTGAFLLGQDYIGLRGYADNSKQLNQFVANSSNPVGGLAFAKFTSELRYLVSDMPMATIYGLTFFEAGNNFHSYKEINPYKLYRSFGAGVRLFMPMFGGLIGFDFAFPLDSENQAGQTSPFRNMETHFSIGAPLR